jgi:hypothetical protein
MIDCPEWPTGEVEANSWLVAAAPELLDTMRFVRQTVHQAHHDGPIEECRMNTCAAMHDVIRKAEGCAQSSIFPVRT